MKNGGQQKCLDKALTSKLVPNYDPNIRVISKAYFEPCQTSKMEFFAKIIDDLLYFSKRTMLDI